MRGGKSQNDSSEYVCFRVTEQNPGLRGAHGNLAVEPTGLGVCCSVLFHRELSSCWEEIKGWILSSDVIAASSQLASES